jgi:anti-sigma B factor antagonist
VPETVINFLFVPVSKETAVVEIGRSLDFNNVAQFKQKASEQAHSGIKNFILDFSSTQVLDSAGLGAIFSLYRRISHLRGKVLIAAPSFPVEVVILLTRIYKVLPKFETVEGAKASVA